MEPINYGALQTQLDLSPLQRGGAMRRDNRAQEAQELDQRERRQLAQAKFTQEQEGDVEFQEWLKTFSLNPNPMDLLFGASKFPSHANALQEGFKGYKTAQQQDIIGTVVGAMGMVSAGNAAGAVAKITERRDALKRNGIDTTQTDAAIELFKSPDPVKQKQGVALLSTVLWGAVGSDDAAKIMSSFGLGAKDDLAERKLAQTDRSLELRERSVDASIARSDAANARADRAEARRGASGGSGGKGRGKKGAYTDAQLDALIN